MKLFAQIIGSQIIQLSHGFNKVPNEDWYEIEREPDLLTEQLRYDPEKDQVVIEPRIKGIEEMATEQRAKEEAALFTPAKMAELEKRIATLEKP